MAARSSRAEKDGLWSKIEFKDEPDDDFIAYGEWLDAYEDETGCHDDYGYWQLWGQETRLPPADMSVTTLPPCYDDATQRPGPDGLCVGGPFIRRPRGRTVGADGASAELEDGLTEAVGERGLGEQQGGDADVNDAAPVPALAQGVEPDAGKGGADTEDHWAAFLGATRALGQARQAVQHRGMSRGYCPWQGNGSGKGKSNGERQ